MKINVKRAGGYAGLEEQVVSVDTSRLEPAAARRIEQQIDGAGFFDLPAAGADDPVGADMYRYEFTASDGGRQNTVSFSQGSPSAASLFSLIEELKRLS
jgi:hypothetical protein